MSICACLVLPLVQKTECRQGFMIELHVCDLSDFEN